MSEHDYTQPYWSHDVGVDVVKNRGHVLDAHGWGTGVRPGDYLLLPNGPGSTRYQVETIRYTADPPDMWFAELRFAPR